jgi:hypothetical protein
MATGNDASGKSRLRRLAMPGVLAAASAGIGLLLTTKPERLRGAIDRLSGRAEDLVGNLKQRAESGSQAGAEPNQSDTNDFEARRRERKKRREQRRHHART